MFSAINLTFFRWQYMMNMDVPFSFVILLLKRSSLIYYFLSWNKITTLIFSQTRNISSYLPLKTNIYTHTHTHKYTYAYIERHVIAQTYIERITGIIHVPPSVNLKYLWANCKKVVPRAVSKIDFSVYFSSLKKVEYW